MDSYGGQAVQDVVRLGEQLKQRVRARASSDRRRGVALFGVGQEEIMLGLERLEAGCERSVWNANPTCGFDPEDLSLQLNERSRSKGVDFRTVASARAARFHPLLSSIEPEARVGPAVLKFIVVDGRTAVVEGPDTSTGDTTAWLILDRGLLADLTSMWSALWDVSRPLLDDNIAPPLASRQLEVARLMCVGHTDASIARALALSPRSVARDIALIMHVTQSRSRPECVLAMLGRGRYSRT